MSHATQIVDDINSRIKDYVTELNAEYPGKGYDAESLTQQLIHLLNDDYGLFDVESILTSEQKQLPLSDQLEVFVKHYNLTAERAMEILVEDTEINREISNRQEEMITSVQQSKDMSRKEGIQHSAVFDDRKSGVIISKADEKREGFFLGRSKRDSVRRDAAAAPKQDIPNKGVDTKNRSNDTHGL